MFKINHRDKQGIFERAYKWVIAFAFVTAIAAISSFATHHETQAASLTKGLAG